LPWGETDFADIVYREEDQWPEQLYLEVCGLIFKD
jgi:hypothetical protein